MRRSRSIIAKNDSPDVGFEVSVNPYRGCEHGCIYCYARPTHEFLGYSAGLDFETRIFARAALVAGNRIAGPALIEERASTTVLMAGDRLEVEPYGNLAITVGKGER